ncbi:hypothetical protein BC937DRAFT_91252 [Endogone sp. FLAS-F59071]|nr:hypothetical protein BC937DRAFT_91252 [Endogone sp. FLAS-F59071]|eukprot:RUS16402.1 hypothetical protein BC937DRAFT_91252 [Endogone sp. FLAS-F59071]
MPPKRTRKPTAKPPVSSVDNLLFSDKENSNPVSEPPSRKRTLDDTLVADDSGITTVKEKAAPVTPTRERQDEGPLMKRLKLPDDETKILLENLQVEIQDRCRKLENCLTTLSANLRARGKMNQARLPEGVRKMTLREFADVYHADVKQYYEAQVRKRMESFAVKEMPVPPSVKKSNFLSRTLAEKRLREAEAGSDTGISESEDEAGKLKSGRGVKANNVYRQVDALESMTPANIMSPRKTRRQRNQAATGTEKPKPPDGKLKRGKAVQPTRPIDVTVTATPKAKPTRSQTVMTEIQNKPSSSVPQEPLVDATPTTTASAPTPSLHSNLPYTPQGQRRPRRGESILSFNGSPLVNPLNFLADDGGEDIEAATPIRSLSSSAATSDRPPYPRDRVRSNALITLPLEDGTMLQVDPTTQSPSRIKNLGAEERKKLAEQLAQYQTQLKRWMANLEGAS